MMRHEIEWSRLLFLKSPDMFAEFCRVPVFSVAE